MKEISAFGLGARHLCRVMAGSALVMYSYSASAADHNCGGRVAWVMADHSGCGGFLASKTEATGGKGGRWICTKSRDAGAVVLSALLADKTVSVYIEASDVGGVCTALPNYRQISYVIIDP